jgi:hypothetical protein
VLERRSSEQWHGEGRTREGLDRYPRAGPDKFALISGGERSWERYRPDKTRPGVWLGAIGWERSGGPSAGEQSAGPRRRSEQRKERAEPAKRARPGRSSTVTRTNRRQRNLLGNRSDGADVVSLILLNRYVWKKTCKITSRKPRSRC